MKIACTSDWQLSGDNIHKAKLFVKYLFAYCEKNKIDVIGHLGDSKHQYSPVDPRVYNFKVDVIKEARERNIQWYQLLGNHDRIGMADDAGNWFPVLRAAGAKCITRPKTVSVGDMRVAMVPYMSDPSALRDAFKRVSKEGAELLFFHCEIRGCKGNVLSTLKGGVALEDLYYKAYKFCLGGHIHLPQQLGENTVYVGPPFSMDWGEANQSKRFVVYDSTSKKLISVSSPVPGMYDPSWPGFEQSKPKSWKGAQVRIHVPCDGAVTDIQKILQTAISKAEREYKGAAIVAIPEFVDNENPELSKVSKSDDETLLKEYIDSTVPPYLVKDKDKIHAYLLHQLAETGFVRRASQKIKFIEAEGKNVLCYKKVKLRFKHKGIIVITGKNLDWPKRSNGTGKTSLMMLPAIALQGKTLKGQSNDRWVRRRSNGIAWVKLRLRLQDGRYCTISRTRRPTKLNLIINDVNRSTGIGTRGTQQAIDNLTGLSWEAITNGMYVEQAETNKILTGKDSERKAIFSKLLNHERFELARELLRKELTKLVRLKEDSELALQSAKDKLKTLKAVEVDYDTTNEYDSTKKELKVARIQEARTKFRIRKYTKLYSKREKQIETIKEQCTQQSRDADSHKDTLLELKGAYKKDLNGLESISDKCPTCKQGVSKDWVKRRDKILSRGLIIVNNKIDAVDKILNKLDSIKDRATRRLSKIDDKLTFFKNKLHSAEAKRELLEERFERIKHKKKLQRKYSRKIKDQEIRVKRLSSLLTALNYEQSLVTYGIKVYSKDGLPAYMVKAIIPYLNMAAEKYARLIGENEIRVKFAVAADGEIDVKINNKHGGEDLEDQSQGELRIASINTSFAIREVISPSNVLFLDEPGEGLDAHNIKLFSQALKEIAKQFGTVFITTHNSLMLQELAGEKMLCVEKRDRVARLVGV